MSDDLQDAPNQPDTEPVRAGASALRLIQRTASAISPWVRHWWTGNQIAGTPTASTAPQRSVAGPRVPGQMPLALHVQRTADFAAHSAGGELNERFSQSIIQRHSTAEHIERRYRNEPRQPATPAPAQLPLPGVQGGARVQRAPGELSLEELARSFASPIPADSAPLGPIQREMETGATNLPGQATTLSDMQEAVRRAAQLQPTPPATTEQRVQRSPEDGSSTSMVSILEERVRQARERKSTQAGQPSAASQPANLNRPSTPPAPSVQRSPATPPPAAQPSAPAAPSQSTPGGKISISEEIAARVRAARERVAGGQASPPASSASTASESPAPIQRSVDATAPASFDASTSEVVEVPKELPFTPTADRDDPGFSKTMAVREQIQRAIERKREAALLPKRPPTEEELQRKYDPNASEYSKTEVLKKRRIEGKLSGKKMEFSSDPANPNYSVTSALRRRTDEAALQRSPQIVPSQLPSPPTATPAESQSSAESSGTPPADAPPSITQQIRDRIQAARERPEQGATPPAASQNPPSAATNRPAGAQSDPGAPQYLTPSAAPGEAIQRVPEDRVTIVRDIQRKSSLPSGPGDPPQERRVRALSKSQIMTPERKTGDFLAGETPKPQSAPATNPSSVQRSVDSGASTKSRSSTPTLPERTPAPGSSGTTPVQRSAEATPQASDEEPVQRQVDEHLEVSEQPPSAIAPAAPAALEADQIQRLTDTPVSSEPPFPSVMEPPATQPIANGPSAIQRASEDSLPVEPKAKEPPPVPPATEPTATMSPAPPLVQRSAESNVTSPVESPAPPATPLVQRTTERTLEQPPLAEAKSDSSAQAVVQRQSTLPTISPAALRPGDAAGSISQVEEQPPASPSQPAHTIQRDPVGEPGSVPTAFNDAQAPETVQRTPETLSPVETPPTPLASPEHHSETTVLSDSESSAPAIVQRLSETASSAMAAPVASEAPVEPQVVQHTVATPPTAPKPSLPVQPTTAEGGPIQRTPESRVESKAEQPSSEIEPAPPALQRSVDSPAAPASQPSLQSPPVDAGVSVTPPLPSPSTAEPTVQRTFESTAAAPKEIASPSPSTNTPVQRSAESEGADESQLAAASDAPSTPSKESSRRAKPTASEPSPVPTAPAASAPVNLQRTPEERPDLRPDTPAAVSADASLPGAAVQRSTESTSPVDAERTTPPVHTPLTDLSAGPSSVEIQRHAEPASEKAPPATEPSSTESIVQRQVESRALPPIAPADTASAEVVQRMPSAPAEGAVMPLSPSASPTPPSTTTQNVPAQNVIGPSTSQQPSPPVDALQRSPETPTESHAPTPAPATSLDATPAIPPVAPSIQRTQDVSVPSVQVSAETPQITAQPALPASDSVQRTPVSSDSTKPAAPSSAPAPPALSTPAPTTMPEVIQRNTVAAPEAEPVVSPRTPAKTPQTLQRTVEAPAERGEGQPVSASTTPPVSASPAIPPATPPLLETPSASTVQRRPEPDTTKSPESSRPGSVAPEAKETPAAASAHSSVPAAETIQRSSDPTAVNAPLPADASPLQSTSVEPAAQGNASAAEQPGPDSIQRSSLPSAERIVAPSESSVPDTPGKASPLEGRADAFVAPTLPPATTSESAPTPSTIQRAPESPRVPPPAPSVSPTVAPSPANEKPATPLIAPSRRRATEAVQRLQGTDALPSSPQVPTSSSSTPLAIQRQIGDSPVAPEASTRTLPGDGLPVQRSAETSGESIPPLSLASAPSAEPAPSATLQRAHEEMPFRPINRYRDPRVLSRAVEPGPPVIQTDLPLTLPEPAAILPQARLAPAMPLANMPLQRAVVKSAEGHDMQGTDELRRAITLAAQQQMEATPSIQRSPEESEDRPRRGKQRAKRALQPPSTRPVTVRRSPLPLAKLPKASNKEVVQRAPTDPLDETFVGSSAATSARGRTQTQNLGGSDSVIQNGGQGSSYTQDALPSAQQGPATNDSNGVSGKNATPDFDRLARAILPIIKRMLAVERDRKTPRRRW